MNPIALIFAIMALASLTAMAASITSVFLKNPDDAEMSRHAKFVDAFNIGDRK